MNKKLWLTVPMFLLCLGCKNSSESGNTIENVNENYGLTLPRKSLDTLQFPVDENKAKISFVKMFPQEIFVEPIHMEVDPLLKSSFAVVERGGKIFGIDSASPTSKKTEWIDLNKAVNNFYAPENTASGLLGFAFDPMHLDNGYFYVYVTVRTENMVPALFSKVFRFHRDVHSKIVDSASGVEILSIPQPDVTAHKGGMLTFGPEDGLLYLATGDGGIPLDPDGNAQNKSTLLGKMIRINVHPTKNSSNVYQVPSDNPFAGGQLCGLGMPVANSPCGEIWAYGLRHPWRYSIDPVENKIWIGDVGHHTREEVNVIPAGSFIKTVDGGKNLGWNICEGTKSPIDQSTTDCTFGELPILDYAHGSGTIISGFSITGGVVYRGSSVDFLKGRYVFADFATGSVWALDESNKPSELGVISNVTAFAQDAQRELYVLSLSGDIYKLAAQEGTQNNFPKTLSATGLFKDTENLIEYPGIYYYEVQQPLWSDGAEKKRWIALPKLSQIQFSENSPWIFPLGTALVKHFEISTLQGLKKLETRVMHLESSGWKGYTYKWRPDQKDADLLEDSLEENIAVDSQKTIRWHYPSRQECFRCHTSAAGFVLGVQAKQLRKSILYKSNILDQQLRALKHIGVFSNEREVNVEGTTLLPREVIEKNASWRGPWVRGYLHSNCAHCHRPQGGTPVNLDFRYETLNEEMNAIDVAAQTEKFGLADSRIIRRGHHDQSTLWLRLTHTDQRAMPPMGKSIVDDLAKNIIADWIDKDL